MTGAELQLLRNTIGMSRKEFADATGVDNNTVWNWETKRAQDELKPWVPLAIQALAGDKFRVIDGEIWVRAITLAQAKVNGSTMHKLPDFDQPQLEI